MHIEKSEMNKIFRILPCASLLLTLVGSSRGDDRKAEATNDGKWELGAPIITYWAGPGFVSTPMTDAAAQQLKAGGWNLAWCREKELDIVAKHGLRAQLNDPLL